MSGGRLLAKCRGKFGVCPTCALRGATASQPLRNSHVIPRSVFRGIGQRATVTPTHQFIVLSGDANDPLDVSQDQGVRPMLCQTCEQRLSLEIEAPALTWARDAFGRRFVDMPGDLLCRFAASIWWRAMLSDHPWFAHITFDQSRLIPIIDASLLPDGPKSVSFRLRRFRDLKGHIPDGVMRDSIYTLLDWPEDAPAANGGVCFTLIAEGFAWEVFFPRLSAAQSTRIGTAPRSTRRFQLGTLAFDRDDRLLHHGALQLHRHREDSATPAFAKRIAKQPS